MTASILTLGAHRIAADLTVVEFLVGMALCRKGPGAPAAIAAEVSSRFDRPVRASALAPALASLRARGWAHQEAGAYRIAEEGIEALRGFYVAMVRLLDGGRRLLDVAVFMSFIQEFERNRP
jgi:hypothetical protein